MAGGQAAKVTSTDSLEPPPNKSWLPAFVRGFMQEGACSKAMGFMNPGEREKKNIMTEWNRSSFSERTEQ